MKEKQLTLFDWEEQYTLYLKVEEEFNLQENEEIEYKSARDGFPKELWKTYSAFANTNSGIIILGVKEKKGVLSIEGLTDEQIEQYKKQFWNECNNPNSISRNLLRNEDVKILNFEGKNLLCFRIPFASRTERPIYLTRNPLGNTYKRNHEGDYRCTDEEVKRMLADSNGELKRDSLILEDFTVSDFDPTSIKQFRQLFNSSKPDHPWHALDDLELFKKIGAYRVDRKTRTEGITLAGLLMFGREESIKEQSALPNFFPDFRERLSSDEKIRWTDRICPDGTWESNLLQFYLKVWPKLSSTLPKPFRLENDQRVDETPTHVALREAFVNSLVHTDYSLSGNIIIELDTEKFVFSNPGTLLVSIHQYYSGGISECRNPALQQMFMLIGRAEKAGSGVDKIMSGWQDSHWRKPFLELESQPDRVKLTLPMFNVIPDTILDELNATLGDVSQFTPDELTALSFCLIEESISNQRLQYVLNLHRSDITHLLKKLCAEGYLESDNNGRWTTYKIKTKLNSLEKDATSSEGLQKVNPNENKVATSTQKVATPTQKVASSIQKVATSDLDIEVFDMGSKAHLGKNLKREELEKIILKLCKDKHLKREDLAYELGKSESYLRNKILPDLLKSGKLVKRYPFTHNHPEQGYKTNADYTEDL